jgi:hypothetical protein
VLALAVLTLAACGATPRQCPESALPTTRTSRIDWISWPETRKVLGAAGIDPDRIRCNTEVRWETRLDQYAREIVKGLAAEWGVSPSKEALRRARHHALGYLVRSFYEESRLHNLGALALKGHFYLDEKGRRRPLVVFRSGLVVDGPGASPCFVSLIRDGAVRHVLNLYTGTFPFRDLIWAERQLAARLGASYFDAAAAPEANWRQDVEDEEAYRRNLPRVTAQIAGLIRGQILRPGGKLPRGNIYFHCAGGMHRSGMIFAILRRCLNQEPMSAVELEYKRHVGWRSPAQPGGFEALNLRLVRDFDCSLLGGPATAVAR